MQALESDTKVLAYEAGRKYQVRDSSSSSSSSSSNNSECKDQRSRQAVQRAKEDLAEQQATAGATAAQQHMYTPCMAQ
jgi:hypothetical protein